MPNMREIGPHVMWLPSVQEQLLFKEGKNHRRTKYFCPDSIITPPSRAGPVEVYKQPHANERNNSKRQVQLPTNSIFIKTTDRSRI
jgi:hypothetical protein